MPLKIDSIRAPMVADQNPVTVKPLTTVLVIFSIKPLTTMVKTPRVIILIGKVNKSITGLITAFTIPRIKAANKAAKKPLSSIPLINEAVSKEQYHLVSSEQSSPS